MTNSCRREAILALVILVASCNPSKKTAPRIYQMGERSEAGSLVYTVLEVEWDPDLGSPRVPEHRFVALRVSVTNGGPEDVMLPAMQLVARNGRTYPEVSDGAGITEWLGVLRRLSPAETVHGRVLFDAPRADYHLRVTDEALNPEEANVALIDVPLRFESRHRALPATVRGQ